MGWKDYVCSLFPRSPSKDELDLRRAERRIPKYLTGRVLNSRREELGLGSRDWD